MKKLQIFILLALTAVSLDAQYTVGDKVQDFKLKGTDGKMHSMSDFQNAKGYIVTFTCNTCPFAQKYEDRIIALNTKYAPMGYPVIAINANDVSQQPMNSMSEMKKRAEAKNYDFPYLRDDDQTVAKRFGAMRTPEIYLLVKKANGLFLAYTGAIDDNVDSPQQADKHFVAMAINDVMKDQMVEIPETRAVGCSIKWKE